MDWFRHDINAQGDIKIRKLVHKYGICAYGAFWLIVELLYRQGGSASAQDISDEFDLMDVTGMKEILEKSGLFEIAEDGSWSSKRVGKELSIREDLRSVRSEAGRKGAESRWQNGKAMANDGKAMAKNATDKTDKTDNKEKVVSKDTPKKKNFQKPSLDEIKAYCKERNNSVDAQIFFDFYESKGWMIGKNHMRDWKAAVRTWESSDTQSRIPHHDYECIKGTNIRMSLVADGTREEFPEPEVKWT